MRGRAPPLGGRRGSGVRRRPCARAASRGCCSSCSTGTGAAGGAGDAARVTNYLAWPVHIQMDAEELEANISGLKGRARLVLCGLNGEPMSARSRQGMPPREPDEREWSEGLTAMRRAMLDRTDARVILGGRLDKYKGSMPGIAEEALLSLESERPVFLIGGFGGCARSVAQALGLAGARAGPRANLAGPRQTETIRRNGYAQRTHVRGEPHPCGVPAYWPVRDADIEGAAPAAQGRPHT